MDSLKGKVALITGTGSGIGKATAIRFAKAGCRLAINDCNAETLEKTTSICRRLDVEVLPLVGDVTAEQDVRRIVDDTIKYYKQLDVLVNNAGTEGFGGMDDTSLKIYDKCMNLNVRSVFHLTMLAVPHLEATKGTIVNVSSVFGMRPEVQQLSYA